MQEKILLTNIHDHSLKTWVIYGHEKRTIEVEPYGKLWTAKYLDKLVDFFEKAGKKEKQENEHYTFLAYLKNKNDESLEVHKNLETFKLNDILPTMTFCKITDVSRIGDKNKAPVKYSIELLGISRYTRSLQFLNEKNKPTGSISDLAAITGTKIPYREVEQMYDAPITDDVTEKLDIIDKTITGLSQNELFQTIMDIKLKKQGLGFDSTSWYQFMSKLGSVNPNDENALIDVVSLLMLYLVVDNDVKYDVLSSKKAYDQVNILYSELLEFYYLADWTKSQKAILEQYPAFKDMKKIDKNAKRDIAKRSKGQEKKPIVKTNKDVITDALIEEEINKKVKDNLEKQQKEYLLREKLKAIKDSLNESNPGSDEEDDEFQRTINDSKKKNIFPESVIKIITSERERLKGMMSGTPDANTTLTYINTLKQMPWRKVEIETLDINKARQVLDKHHYGLKEVKERIIEYLSLIINHKNIAKANHKEALIDLDKNHQIDMELFKEDKNNKKIQKVFNNVPILTLVGPPGTGKTSLARAIAEALNKSYIKISLGGVHDESEIRGHRRTYVGSMPGKIIKAIQRAGVSNPLILLDEIDKMSSDYKGDPSSAMLEVLDPEQNSKFQDNYLEHEYDLSKVMFIATANYYENIPAPLIDRVEILELHSYTISEKIKIAREHLLDICIQQAGLNAEQFQISDDVIEFIIKRYTAEAGVRALKRSLDKIARKIVTMIISGQKIKEFKIDEDKAIELLGTPKFSESDNEKVAQVGVVNGLAYTSIGGTTLQIEVSAYPSKNAGIKLTGSLKDVMKESANIALTYVRSHAKDFDIHDFDFDNSEIHVHVPEGAVPKDGPSAGVTFTTALISALSHKPVSQDVAMTGEITLRGRVLEIGGLKEKSFAAFKKGVKTVFIPKNNEKNLTDIPEEVKEAIKFVPVEKYEEIYDHLFKHAKAISGDTKVITKTKKDK